jgi:hypothetical protein
VCVREKEIISDLQDTSPLCVYIFSLINPKNLIFMAININLPIDLILQQIKIRTKLATKWFVASLSQSTT